MDAEPNGPDAREMLSVCRRRSRPSSLPRDPADKKAAGGDLNHRGDGRLGQYGEYAATGENCQNVRAFLPVFSPIATCACFAGQRAGAFLPNRTGRRTMIDHATDSQAGSPADGVATFRALLDRPAPRPYNKLQHLHGFFVSHCGIGSGQNAAVSRLSIREVRHLGQATTGCQIAFAVVGLFALGPAASAEPNPAAAPGANPAAATGEPAAAVGTNFNDGSELQSEFPEQFFRSAAPGNWPVPAISGSDLAHGIAPIMVLGTFHPLSGGPAKLTDGSGAETEDNPSNCFFFDNGAPQGRFRLSLAQAESIGQINLYAWHRNALAGGVRAPLKVDVYAARGETPGLDLNDPHSPGYVLLARINTVRPGGVNAQSGQHGASVFPVEGQTLGDFQHFLFEVFSPIDGVTHTFITEVDIVRAAGPAVTTARHAGRQTVRPAGRWAAGKALSRLPQLDRSEGWARFDACRIGRGRGRQRSGLGAGQTRRRVCCSSA